MKVLWVHNYNPNINGNQSWLKVGFDDLSKKIQVDNYYIGDLNSIKKIYNAYIGLVKISSKYDIVHSQYGSICGFLASFLPKVKTVVSFKGSDYNGQAQKNFKGNVKNILTIILSRISLIFSDKVIVMSNRMKNSIPNILKYKVFVIPDGVNLETFCPIDKAYSKSIIGLKEDNTFVISFATVHKNPIKRLDFVSKLIEKLKIENFPFTFNFITNIEHDLIKYHLNASDLLLLTSKSEGWPNIIKEGLACNVPFVSTDVSDLKTISDIEESCFVCKYDLEEFVSAIKKVKHLESPTNLTKYVSDMALPVITEKLIKVYKELI
jgi:teichuronic acid biosynthesis glycosyltransferase TuaC